MALLALHSITKLFGTVHALRGVDFSLLPGEVHALLGENGAGKSTLMHIAYGLLAPDAGEVRVDDVPRAIDSPRIARRLGIGMVHQHFTSIPALTAAENIALTAGWGGSPTAVRARVTALSARLRMPIDPNERAGRLSVVLKQRLEILKALASEARILLLDEPTAVLTPRETEELFALVRRFAASSGGVVLITHKLNEVLTVADRVTVLRQGSVTLSGPVAGQTADSLAIAMLGEAPTVDRPRRRRLPPGAPPLALLDHLEVPRESGHGIAVRGATLTIRAGEIVGIAAVEGNGQRELLRAVAERQLPLRGKLVVARPIGFVPEDRTTEGLIPELTLTENVVLGSTMDDPWVRSGRVDWRVARARTAALIEEYDVVAASPDVTAATLSGGNQQKLIVARELSRRPQVVVAENPTRGLDIHATAAIHQRFRDAAEGGAAVLFHSSDLDEVLELADRIAVVVRGEMREVPANASRAEIGELMVSGGR